MHVAIVTVGDELLAGETTNTNASWLGTEITERGGTVDRILTIPDEEDLIAQTIANYSDMFEAVIVTGGLGGTPDDVTMAAVADGLERDLEVRPEIRSRLLEKSRKLRESRPELFEYDLEFDFDRGASLPVGARAIVTDQGWAPGCVIENVYVFAGFPDEMRAMFEQVADEFAGDKISRSLWTAEPEGALNGVLEGTPKRFDVTVGSYPTKGDAPGRIRVTATAEGELEAALEWIRDRVEPAPSQEESD